MPHYYFNNRNGEIYPDFIGKLPDNRVVADAKYKPQNNIKNSDYSQILSYMFRFDCKQAYFFHPSKEEHHKILYLMTGVRTEVTPTKNEDVRVEKIGLKIPKASRYEEFVDSIKKSEKQFLDKLNL